MKPWHQPVTFWTAGYNAPEYNFLAYGSTRDEAYLALRQALEAHRSRYNLGLDWAGDWETAGYTYQVRLGEGYCNNKTISHLYGEAA